MADKKFDEWLSSFRSSIATYAYYVDFEKVVEHVQEMKVELNIMNSLIGSKNVKQDFINLVQKYPSILKCIPLLIAVRSKEILITDGHGTLDYNFYKPNYSAEQYAVFMEKIGLFEIISNRLSNNLYDYAMGVETGLDSNGRKNRGGHLMEDLVESYIKQMNKPYFKEMYLEEIERKYGIDLSAISNHGDSTKRFDFVVQGEDTVYAIEVNFYTSSGSKLNETARSYKMIAEESKSLKHFCFVWITDGCGWQAAKGNLKETFDVMNHIYCIKELEEGALKRLN